MVVVMVVVVVVVMMMMVMLTMMIMMMAAATNVCTEENATLCQRMSGPKHPPLLHPSNNAPNNKYFKERKLIL